MRIPLAIQSYRARSLPLSAQRLVNLFPERTPPDAKSPLVLYGTPGLKTFSTIGSGPIRGLHVMDGTLYAVSGPEVYRVEGSGGATLLGSLLGSGRVGMADNGTQILLVVPGTAGYVVTATGVARVTDEDFPTPASVAFLDGYHVVARHGTGQFFVSATNQATDWNALDFATAEAFPDDLVAVIADHRELWLFGLSSIEVWYNSGAADFPFERISGAFVERGCLACDSVAKLDNSIFWLGEDKAVYRAAGYTPQRVSTHAIEHAIEGFADPAAAAALVYSQEGHHFYALSFAEASFVYDASNDLWHERESRDGLGNSLGRWRANCAAQCYGKTLVGDYANGSIYELDLDTYDEAGIAVRREAASPPIHADTRRAFMSRFALELEGGVGLTTGQGSDPQVMLQWSDDGGRSWSAERWRSMGALGDFRRRVEWRRLGSFRERIVRVGIADPVKIAVLAADAEVA